MIDSKHLFRLTTICGQRDAIAAGPLIKHSAIPLYRIELCDLDECGFVVCAHFMAIDDHGTIVSSYYGDGRYFKKDQLDIAVKEFGRALMRDREHRGVYSLFDQGNAMDRTVRLGGGGGLLNKNESVPGPHPSDAAVPDSPYESVPGSVPSDDGTQDFPVNKAVS